MQPQSAQGHKDEALQTCLEEQDSQPCAAPSILDAHVARTSMELLLKSLRHLNYMQNYFTGTSWRCARFSTCLQYVALRQQATMFPQLTIFNRIFREDDRVLRVHVSSVLEVYHQQYQQRLGGMAAAGMT